MGQNIQILDIIGPKMVRFKPKSPITENFDFGQIWLDHKAWAAEIRMCQNPNCQKFGFWRNSDFGRSDIGISLYIFVFSLFTIFLNYQVGNLKYGHFYEHRPRRGMSLDVFYPQLRACTDLDSTRSVPKRGAGAPARGTNISGHRLGLVGLKSVLFRAIKSTKSYNFSARPRAWN